MRLILIWLLAVLAVSGTAAQAAYPPRPDGPVLDAAGIIPDGEESALVQRLNAYNQQTGRAIMVVTVPSLEGEDVASYANALGHTWGVGGKETDQGLILLVAPTERKLRIEVGYGLEAILPDVMAARIIRETISPRFKAGDFPGGISAGLDAIQAQLDRDPAEARAIAEAAEAGAKLKGSAEGIAENAAGAFFWIVLIILFALIFSRRARRFARKSDIDPGIVLWGISEILHHASRSGGSGGWSSGGGGSDWGGFGGGDFGGGGASGDW
jgi:uncharacterized protein